jgi:hypothetical protein
MGREWEKESSAGEDSRDAGAVADGLTGEQGVELRSTGSRCRAASLPAVSELVVGMGSSTPAASRKRNGIQSAAAHGSLPG